MDRALKERVIGAVALVAIAVLVVPVFLDGPATEAEIVSESVNLPGQNEQARKRQTIVLERDRDRPVPVSATLNSAATTAAEKLAADAAARKAASRESEAEPEKESPPPKTDKAEPSREAPKQRAPTSVAKAEVKAEAAAAAPESVTGMWAVQLGSFSDQANAERLAAELRKNGYAAFLSKLKTASGSLNRVRVGPQKDRSSAEAVAVKLRDDGHKGQVVPHP